MRLRIAAAGFQIDRLLQPGTPYSVFAADAICQSRRRRKGRGSSIRSMLQFISRMDKDSTDAESKTNRSSSITRDKYG